MTVRIHPAFGVIISALIAVPAAGQSYQSEGLELSCSGSGVKTVTEHSTTYSFKDGKSQPVNSMWDRKEGVQGTVRFAMTADGPRLRLFPGLMPDLNVEGAAKWRKVEDFVMNDSIIKGNVSTGILSQVSFEIDRHNGDIQVVGYNKHFAGNCVREASNGNARRF